MKHLYFEFVPWGYVLEPKEGIIAVDVGNKMVPGVIDHHQRGCDYGCAASIIARNPSLVLEHLQRFPTDRLTIVVHQQPDFDCVASAWLVAQLYYQGQLPDGAQHLADYAEQVDAAQVPKDVDFLTSLHGVYLAATALLEQNQKDTTSRDLFRAQIDRGFDLLDHAMDSMAKHATGSQFQFAAPFLFHGTHPFEAELAHLKGDLQQYYEDVERSEIRPLTVLNRDGSATVEVDLLSIEAPRSTLFKYLARTDRDLSPRGEGFRALHVRRRDRSDRSSQAVHRHVISVDPTEPLSLRGLGFALEAAEEARRAELGLERGGVPRWPDVSNDDPWYDGRSPVHRFTIVDSPREGSVLTPEEVSAILLAEPGASSWQSKGSLATEWYCPECGQEQEDRAAEFCSRHRAIKIPASINDYQIIRKLGHGGMGDVYEVRDQARDRPAALKIIRADLLEDNGEGLRRRFEREARIASACVHPNLVNTYDRGENDQVGLWFVMELLRGIDLQESIRGWFGQHPDIPYPARQGYEILQQTCEGLSALHERGIVHRDLKPANIFLATDEIGWARVKLLDFGIARRSWAGGHDLTSTDQVVGTWTYMAPEVLMDGGVAERPYDVYALGCILYKMLSNQWPHMHTGDKHMLAVMRDRMLAPPDLGDIPGGDRTHALLTRALDPTPDKRGTVAEFREELAGAMDLDLGRFV